jgi:carbon monoxide dehydrogenase subunit G
MEMQGNRLLAITQQQAWDALNDPEVLKTCIAGCDKVERSGENQFVVGVAIKIGPVSAKFSGKIALADMAPPHSYTLRFEGQGGPAGFGKGSAKVQLTPATGGTELSYSVQASVGGKIAQLGQRLIDGVAKSMAEDFFKRFDQEMQRQYPPVDVPATPVVQASASEGGFKLPAWGWVAGAVVLALAVWLLR